MIRLRGARCAMVAGAFCLMVATAPTLCAVPLPEAHQMLRAARWWMEASRLIYEAKLDRGIPISEADVGQTGLIGEEYTPITTTLGPIAGRFPLLTW